MCVISHQHLIDISFILTTTVIVFLWCMVWIFFIMYECDRTWDILFSKMHCRLDEYHRFIQENLLEQ